MANPTTQPPQTAKKPEKTPEKPAIAKPQPRKVRPDVYDPIGIYFQSGPYKGMAVDLGTAIPDVSYDQSAEWARQNGQSIRVGSNFKSISPRGINLQLEFCDLEKDVTPRVENLMTLQEIDPATGAASTLFYQEGKLINISPVVCTSIKVKKSEPFLGDRGFKYATVDLTLELLGGKTSEHSLGKPLTETDLTKARAAMTAAEREKQGEIAVAKQALVKCIGQEESDRVGELLQSNKMKNVGALKQLPAATLVQIAVGGMLDKDTLKKLEPDIRASLVTEIARKTEGVGNNAQALAGAISGKSAALLPADLQKLVPQLQQDYQLLAEAIVKQDLGQQSAVYSNRSANDSLIKIAGCGMSVRSQASAVKQSSDLSPQQQQYFEQKLGAQASDPSAREKYVLDELNKALGGKDDEIRKKFKISTDEELQALKNAKPYKSKDEFVQRMGQTQGSTGLSIWQGFMDNLANSTGIPTP